MLAAAVLTATSVVGVPGAVSSRADTAPPAGLPATVSADALPTVQQNGVVWAQVTVGNTVYATGKFSQTWPAGKTNTPANDTPRGNLLAYDITTGNLITSFNHTLNAQGLAITASPDGSQVYVGGDFTSVDGQARGRIAAFNVATGALDPTFKPSLNAQVHAITASNTTVYAGGIFSLASGVARGRLAAFAASNGALSTTWAPTVEQGVDAMVLTPDQTEVVIGGAFQFMNGGPVNGLGAATTATGKSVPYAINKVVHSYTPADHPPGAGGAILSLATDGNLVYGSGYSYYDGNLEGSFGVDPDTGAIKFINDCHGDTYGVFAVGQVLYTVSHAHNCQWIGAFPNSAPSGWVTHHTLAFTAYATGKNSGPDDYGWQYQGQPDSTLLQWYPTIPAGTVTGQSQAAWSVTGNSRYIAEGGEFPSVNGVAQAGLVRFAVSSAAPNKSGPRYNATALTPTVTAQSATSAKVSWTATWDYDNQALSYRVYRDGAGPVYTVTTKSNFWQLPSMSFTDSGLAAGSTHSYVVRVYDAFNNTTNGNAKSIKLP